jgi:hypothetical protein
MLKLSIYAALLLTLLPVCLAAQQIDPQSTVKSNSPLVSIAKTTWSGTESDGTIVEYYFQEDGSLYYKTPSGLFKNGSWKQEDKEIYMEMNNKYVQHQGTISGTRMQGTAWNETGLTWTWAAEKK